MKILILSSFTMIFPMIRERYIKFLIILDILAKKYIFFHPFFVEPMQNQSKYTLLQSNKITNGQICKLCTFASKSLRAIAEK